MALFFINLFNDLITKHDVLFFDKQYYFLDNFKSLINL
jgi:hypothetical protein